MDRSTGNVAVKRITVGHDCGLIINPDGLKFQIEANAIQGVSRAVLEEVKFDETGIKSVDWRSYPVITFRNVPEVDIVLKNRPQNPSSGAGEPGIVPIFGAIGNAIFDAVGARLRERTFHPGASPECDEGQRRNLPARINEFGIHEDRRPAGAVVTLISQSSY